MTGKINTSDHIMDLEQTKVETTKVKFIKTRKYCVSATKK